MYTKSPIFLVLHVNGTNKAFILYHEARWYHCEGGFPPAPLSCRWKASLVMISSAGLEKRQCYSGWPTIPLLGRLLLKYRMTSWCFIRGSKWREYGPLMVKKPSVFLNEIFMTFSGRRWHLLSWRGRGRSVCERNRNWQFWRHRIREWERAVTWQSMVCRDFSLGIW